MVQWYGMKTEYRGRILKTLLEFNKTHQEGLGPSKLRSYAGVSTESYLAIFDEMVEESLIRFEPNIEKGPASGWYHITPKGKKVFRQLQKIT